MINNVNDGYSVAMEVKTVSKYYNMDTICKFIQSNPKATGSVT